MAAFSKEPPYDHAQASMHAGTAVLLCNLGTPAAPTAPALRAYLGEFLSDPRVVEIPRLLWMVILHGIILRVRPAKSAQKYASVWTEQGSPLRAWTAAQAEGVQQRFAAQGLSVKVDWAMRYGQPSVPAQLAALKAGGYGRILVLPLYPQYSGTTTASVIDAVCQWALTTRHLPEFRFLNRFHDHPAYIEAMAQDIERHWAQQGQPERLVLSFHGVPESTLLQGDPYHCECQKTARLLRERLGWGKDRVSVTFQSRFGKAKWLEPATEPSLVALAQQGIHHVGLYCPGFVSDCLETLEELDQEAREAFVHAGGISLQRIPCLNAGEPWLDALTQIAQHNLSGWPTAAPDPVQAQEAARARGLAHQTLLSAPVAGRSPG